MPMRNAEFREITRRRSYRQRELISRLVHYA